MRTFSLAVILSCFIICTTAFRLLPSSNLGLGRKHLRSSSTRAPKPPCARASIRCNEKMETSTRRALFGAAFGLALGSCLPASSTAEGGNTAVMHFKSTDGIEGDIVIELMPDVAPKTVEAFKKWAKDGLYDGTAFHRVNSFLKKVVLVGGDPYTKEEAWCTTERSGRKTCSEGKGYGEDGLITSPKKASNDDNKDTRNLWDKGGPEGWRKDSLSALKLEPEFKGRHVRGTIALRRFGAPDSAGSQFIICLADMSKEMDGNSAVFGKIVSGIELLDKINTEAVLKSSSALDFPRDDGKQSVTWSAWDRPVARQGIESIRIQ